MTFIEPQLSAILGAVWGQGVNHLVWERPNGDMVDDQTERHRRADTLLQRPQSCPHWAEYGTHAIPLVTEAAREQFTAQDDDDALQQLFRQLQTQPWEATQTLRRVALHADLDRVIEADVWPWLEQQCASATTDFEHCRRMCAPEYVARYVPR